MKNRRKGLSITTSGMLFWCLAVAVLNPGTAAADIPVQIELTTGSDDLRGGNRAFFRALLTDGTLTAEQQISSGLGSNTVVATTASLPDTVTRDRIRAIIIRHDGNPRPGYPFDNYDNWDLKRLVVRHNGTTIYESRNDSKAIDYVHYFSSGSRSITKFIRVASGEPDFVITGMFLVPSGVTVVVRNNGASGVTSHVTCFVTGRTASRTERVSVGSGLTVSITVGLASPVGTTTCVVDGTDVAGNPERVTANNVLRRLF